MSDRTYLDAWQQAHREAGADMDRVICERDEARAERDALAARLEAARHLARELREFWGARGYCASCGGSTGGGDTLLHLDNCTVATMVNALLALLPSEPQPEPEPRGSCRCEVCRGQSVAARPAEKEQT